MYGLIGKMTAVAGQRDALASMLLESTQAMPGCLSYIVATDPADADALWITEVWDSAASHQASLSLPAVKAAIATAQAAHRRLQQQCGNRSARWLWPGQDRGTVTSLLDTPPAP